MNECFSDIRFAIIRVKCLIACGFKPVMVESDGKWCVSH